MIRILLILSFACVLSRAEDIDIHAAPHLYSERAPKDRFTLLKPKLEDGTILLDRSSEHAFLVSLLEKLEIPVSSQILVFSTTSLQLSLINPSNPRALYFNEDTYVGYIPGGKIEIISLDPELGGIFYIFDIPKGGGKIAPERSGRCMNCHSGSDSRYVPGLVIKSVVPAPTGGSLDAFRADETGHGIPFAERFGGWYLSGAEGITNHWANTIGRMASGKILRTELKFGERFRAERYPVGTSDLLAHLLHEHQAGFVNRVLEGSYRTRAALHAGNGKLTEEGREKVAKLAREIAGYTLFADEAPLPAPVAGDEAFKREFRAKRLTDDDGRSLKDLDLKERLFRYRCSYMIYSGVFEGMPPELKSLVWAEIEEALSGKRADYAYLGEEERAAIRSILKATLPERRRWEDQRLTSQQ